MAFEFFFGVFGLISSDSKSRHKSRLESEWRLPTPLNANLFRDAGLKSPLAGSPVFKPGQTTNNDSKQRPIFSTTGTLAAASSGGAGKCQLSGDEPDELDDDGDLGRRSSPVRVQPPINTSHSSCDCNNKPPPSP
jgi:hypothetical protein